MSRSTPSRPSSATTRAPPSSLPVRCPPAQPYSQPYWLVKPPAGDDYTVDDQRLIGRPDTPPEVTVRLLLSVDGAPIELVRPVHYRYADRARRRAGPPSAGRSAGGGEPDRFAGSLSDQRRAESAGGGAGEYRKSRGRTPAGSPPGWKVEPRSQSFQIAVSGEQQQLDFTVTPPAGESTASLRAVATVNGREIGSGMELIEYPHIPTQGSCFRPRT